jgi:FkbM family methyltransferase
VAIRELWRRLRWWLIYLGPRRDVTVRTLNGLLTFDSKDWLIGKYLYVRREHERREADEALSLLRDEGYLDLPGETVLNVGANIGMTCIGLVRSGYFSRAVAVEPAPNAYRLLVHNVAQNGLTEKVLLYNFALSSRSARMELEICEDNSGDNRIRVTREPGFFREEGRRTVDVITKTADQMLAEYPALRETRIDLAYVDIQGHEGHFFQGARGLLERGIPVISEFWPYGILRSGFSEAEYQRVAASLFTHFYVLGERTRARRSVSEIPALFSAYQSPRQCCLLAWVRAG